MGLILTAELIAGPEQPPEEVEAFLWRWWGHERLVIIHGSHYRLTLTEDEAEELRSQLHRITQEP